MWPTRRTRAAQLTSGLINFSKESRQLPGIATTAARETLVMQMVASVRRLDYSRIVLSRDVSPARCDPLSELFDPERAAVWYARNGQIDEAVWLTFLSVHFGKSSRFGWKRVRDVYSGLGMGRWTWERVSASPSEFRSWLRNNRQRIGGAFGNHRKYESLNAGAKNGTGEAVESYVRWIGPSRSHRSKFSELIRIGGNAPSRIFDEFYKSMDVARFGRLGKFDFLALLGRLQLAPICPGSTYLKGATGPLRGARLLFGGAVEAPLHIKTLEGWICELDEVLNVGMQVLEDSLCNWQKSPRRFIHFKG